jgi:hypothetical protein
MFTHQTVLCPSMSVVGVRSAADATRTAFLLQNGLLHEEELPQAVLDLLRAGWLKPEDLPITTLDELSERLETAIERGLPPDPWSENESNRT